MKRECVSRFHLFRIKLTDGSLNKGEFLMNRSKRLLIALLLGLLLATQIGPVGAALPIRCGPGCFDSTAMFASGG